jgi:hypothetical protein
VHVSEARDAGFIQSGLNDVFLKSTMTLHKFYFQNLVHLEFLIFFFFFFLFLSSL